MDKKLVLFSMICILIVLLALFCIILPVKLNGLEEKCINTYNLSEDCPCIRTRFNNTLNFSNLSNISFDLGYNNQSIDLL